MNIVELHRKMDLRLDRPRSTRYRSDDRDSAINTATQRIIRDRYDNIRNDTGYSFESVQRLRDELRPLITVANLTPAGNILTYPADYLHELLLQVTVDGTQAGSTPTFYDELEEIKKNPFESPDIDHFYHLETGGFNVEVFFGTYGNFTAGTLHYIKQPVPVFRGTTSITAGPLVLTVGTLYYVESGPVTHNSVTYQTGQTFTAVNNTLNGPGSVIVIVNSELPDNMHEELVRVAASVLSGDQMEPARKQIIESDIQKS